MAVPADEAQAVGVLVAGHPPAEVSAKAAEMAVAGATVLALLMVVVKTEKGARSLRARFSLAGRAVARRWDDCRIDGGALWR